MDTFKIKGYGTDEQGEYAQLNEVEFQIISDNEVVSTKVFSREFMSKILAHSFEIEKFIESGFDHSVNKIDV